MKKAFILLCITLSSCTSYVPFTRDIRLNLENSGVDLTKVQFGIKEKIHLKRSITSTNEKIVDGQYKTENSIVRENIIFRVLDNNILTGICKVTQNERVGIAFEDGDYKLKALSFWLAEDGSYVFSSGEKTKYDGLDYEIKEGKAAILYINKSEINKERNLTRRVTGLKVK